MAAENFFSYKGRFLMIAKVYHYQHGYELLVLENFYILTKSCICIEKIHLV